jgi:hypothetical protein
MSRETDKCVSAAEHISGSLFGDAVLRWLAPILQAPMGG